MFVRLLIGLALSYISYLLTPKPEEPKPAKLSDLDIPKVEEGSEVPVAEGSPWIKAMQVHAYGDFDTKKIKASGGKK